MPSSPAIETVEKIADARPQPPGEPELRAALDNIEQLLRQHATLEPMLLRGRMERAWIMAEGALR